MPRTCVYSSGWVSSVMRDRNACLGVSRRKGRPYSVAIALRHRSTSRIMPRCSGRSPLAPLLLRYRLNGCGPAGGSHGRARESSRLHSDAEASPAIVTREQQSAHPPETTPVHSRPFCTGSDRNPSS